MNKRLRKKQQKRARAAIAKSLDTFERDYAAQVHDRQDQPEVAHILQVQAMAKSERERG